MVKSVPMARSVPATAEFISSNSTSASVSFTLTTSVPVVGDVFVFSSVAVIEILPPADIVSSFT